MKFNPVLVAQNLYRCPTSGTYYGRRKIKSRVRWKSFKTTNRTRADSSLRSWLLELDLAAPSSEMKLGELVERFLATRSGNKPKTVQLDTHLAGVFKRTFRGGLGKAVAQIKTSELLIWLNAQEKARGWSHTTFNRYRLFLYQLFSVAEADGVVTESGNPFKKKFIRCKSHVEPVRNIPTDQEFYAIINDVRKHAGSRRDASADFLAFQGLAALGQAEAEDLKWSDVGEKFLSIQRRKTGERFTVPIYVWLRPLMDKLTAEREDISPDAKVFAQAQAAKALTNACKRLGLTHFSQRNLRQCGIARLAHAGVTPRQAAAWQGHTDGGIMVQKIYRKVKCSDDAALEQAELAKLDKVAVFQVAA